MVYKIRIYASYLRNFKILALRSKLTFEDGDLCKLCMNYHLGLWCLCELSHHGWRNTNKYKWPHVS